MSDVWDTMTAIAQRDFLATGAFILNPADYDALIHEIGGSTHVVASDSMLNEVRFRGWLVLKDEGVTPGAVVAYRCARCALPA